jgi:hypothetical protein
MKSLPLFVLLLLTHLPLSAQNQVLDWLNQTRAEAGLAVCSRDSRLARAAADYAALLAARGRLDHRGPDGGSALQRYRAAGGSATLVGEVLAAAVGPAEAGRAWLASPEHRELLLKPEWSHAGAGSASWGDLTVYVLLFTVQRVRDLAIAPLEEGYLLSGCFLPTLEAQEPLLWAGPTRLPPETWSPRDGCFTFRIPAAGSGLYCRLGYRGPGEELVITDTFIARTPATSPPGKAPR